MWRGKTLAVVNDALRRACGAPLTPATCSSTEGLTVLPNGHLDTASVTVLAVGHLDGGGVSPIRSAMASTLVNVSLLNRTLVLYYDVYTTGTVKSV